MAFDNNNAAALAKANSRIKPQARREKVAVLFVHGQGDQRPMDDLLELAFSTWETDEAASKGAQLATIWSRPVRGGDSMDQRCLTGKDSEKVEVDYHQYYWAPLMSGNRFSHFWLWLTDLIAKRKEDVPAAFRPIRFWMICAARFVTVTAALYAFFSASLLFWWSAEPASSSTITALRWPAVFAAFFLILGLGIVAARLMRSGGRVRYEAESAFLLVGMAFWALAYGLGHYPPTSEFEGTASFSDCPRIVGKLVSSVGANGIHLDLEPSILRECVAFANSSITVIVLVIACIAAIVGWIGVRNFLVPVMADSARYFRARPENIQNREKIRAEGVRKLRRLHAKSAGYDRIIVIGHSLGSSVAYGMLDQYWGEICKKLIVKDRSTVRLFEEACADLDRSTITGVTNAQLKAFRQSQRRLFTKLAKWGDKSAPGETPARWRVSDFITLGSPLAYAPFLLSETYRDYEAHLRKHRRYASCPPKGDKVAGEMRIAERMPEDEGGAETCSLPHSAIFAATRWTNFYFKTRGYFQGDVIGGPVSPIFGPGILDIELDPSETKTDFAHNEYWKWPASATDGVASRGQDSYQLSLIITHWPIRDFRWT
jgi:pimeloyl-ACP methyl ester carboxylesterase